MAEKRTVDTFKMNASQIVFLDRGKGISAPNLQAAIEELQEKLATIDDHLHKGEGENSVKIGLDSFAFGDSSIAIGHGAITSEESERSVSLGADSQAYGVSSVAIGDGALAIGTGAVAIGPGAYADADNIIALGNNGHTVIIPGNLIVIGRIIGSVTWIGPSDDVLAEISTPIEAELPGNEQVDRQLTLKNPGKYRIKGFIRAEVGGAQLEILENDRPITDIIYVLENQRNFSVDFYREIGVNTTITFRLKAMPGLDYPPQGRGSVSQIRICGAPTDIGSGVIGW